MSSFLYRLGRFAFRARWAVTGAWVGLLIVFGALAGLFSQGTSNSITIPGTESQEALDSLAVTFPQVSGTSAQLLVMTDGSDVEDESVRSAVGDAVERLQGVDHVETVVSPFDESVSGAVNDAHDAAIITVQLDIQKTEVTEELKDELQHQGDMLLEALPSGTSIDVGGDAFSGEVPAISPTEGIGLLIALVILFLTFGSLRLAGMPLLTAVIGVGISISIIMLSSLVMEIVSTTPMLALMLGLAVGIDYSLFILSRHVEQVREGMDPEESTARSVATSGSAVIFAGITVIIALVGLSIAQIPFLSIMGIAAAGAVIIAVAVALTLTPALLGFVGSHVGRTKKKAKKPSRPSPVFSAWVRAATKWPAVTILVIVAGLGAVALPATGLSLTLPDSGSLEKGSAARTTFDHIAEKFGDGYNAPLIVTGSVIGSDDPVGLMDDLKGEFEAMDGVKQVLLATPNETGDTGIVQIVPEGAADSQQTKDLVAHIRSLHDHFKQEYDVDLAVTGFTAVAIDVSDRLGSALLPFGLFVVGLSLILLTMVFRSIWVPIKAAIGYLLSVASAFGVVWAVFGWGWGADALHVARVGPIISFMPIVVMGVLFGLAMDYEVFLVSRIKEAHARGADARTAIREGFLSSGTVVTAAALIMFAVFVAFVPEGDTNIKPIALGLATGVFVDAFIVRMTLVPAVLQLLGEHAWWMPKWLDRVLPVLDAEGDGLHRELRYANWRGPDRGAQAGSRADGDEASSIEEDPDAPAVATEALGLRINGGWAYRDRNLLAPAGTALVLASGHRSGKSALLLTLAGRVQPTDGVVKVTGLLLPERAATVRRRVGLVLADANPDVAGDVATILRERPLVLAIDDIDHVAEPVAERRITELLAAAKAREPRFSVIASCTDPAVARRMLEPVMPVQIVRVAPVPIGAGGSVHHHESRNEEN